MKKLLLLGLVLGIVLTLVHSLRRPAPPAPADAGDKLLFDRVWIDHAPRRDTDFAQVFAAVTERPLGIFDRHSVWQGDWELFRYRAPSGGRLILDYPQSGRTDQVTYRAWKCSQDHFDFCLELSGAGRGPRRYFSRRGWEIGRVLDAGMLRREAERLLRSPSGS
jgi:hypothetical protein